MREYVTYGVRLPLDAGAIIDGEAERTGIQKSVLLRSIILGWIEKEHNPEVGARVPTTTPTTGTQPTPNGAVAHD